jgi:hypothetical protein
MGILIASLFRDIKYVDSEGIPTEVGILNLVGTIFFVVTDTVMNNLMETVTVFANERPVFLREQANKMYSVGSYFSAKSLADLP